MKLAVCFLSIVSVALSLMDRTNEAVANERPNVVLIFADDKC